MTLASSDIAVRATCASCAHARDTKRLGEPGLEEATDARPASDAPEIYCSVWRALCTPDTYCAAHRPLVPYVDRRPHAVFGGHVTRARLWGLLGLGYAVVLAAVIELALQRKTPF